MADGKKETVMRPHPGYQTDFAASNVDIAFGAGGVGNGKSWSLLFCVAEPLMLDQDFRALITRRSLQNQKQGGGFVDAFKKIFDEYCSVKTADSPRVSFPIGSYCDLTYIDDTNLDKMRERSKGWQYDMIGIDEITEMPWEVFTYILSRNRGNSKMFTGRFRATYNPKRTHWTRIFVDWYIGLNGRVIPERNGYVRYFYVAGQSVKDVVWGDTKEEVYAKCKIDIDRKIQALGGQFTYKNFIKSFALFVGTVAENTHLMGNNADYVGSVAAAGGKLSQQLLEVDFNIDPDEDNSIPIPSVKARECFINDPAANGDKWITADLADYGTDNLVAIAWNGFHAVDILISGRTTPKENAMMVKAFARDNGVSDNHIIFDATAGRYFKDYIPDSVAFLSGSRPRGIYFLQAMYMKDLCYLRLVKMISRGELTFSEEVAQTIYTHQNLKYRVTVENEFMEECAVVRFVDQTSGKKRLMNKRQMNAMLGHGRSMDLLDPCAMRMFPCVDMEYGSEIEEGFKLMELDKNESFNPYAQSIYDETLWS